MSKIGIIGSGTWGCALSNLISKNGHEVVVWSFDENECSDLNKTREQKNLKGVKLNESIIFTTDLAAAIKNKNLIIFAVPSPVMRANVKNVIEFIDANQILCSVSKGIEDKTLFTMTEIITDELKKSNIKNNKIVALSGPTHAEEVAMNLPTTIVSSSENEIASKFIQDILMNDFFRVYTNTDIKGVEICAVFKNIIAIACGISKGLGYGDNIKAAIIVRGLAEIIRVGEAMKCKKETFYGLAGLGDIVVTSTSIHSRNNRCGEYIGQGLSVDEAVKKVGMVVEGINNLKNAMELKNKYKIDMPILEGMNDIIYNGIDPNEVIFRLMNRDRKAE